ncbi:MAG TPA: hypothetical protein VGI95_18625 [Caulobacteraceae bacterium]|jgi:hypothetical protein
MPVQLVTDPAEMDADPSVHPWAARLKYVTVAELLSDYIASNAAIGRQHCPVANYLAAHLGDEVLEVEAYVYAHPEWGPPALCESLYVTLTFNTGRSHPHGEAIAAWGQHYLALTLVRHHPYERARPEVEAMLKHPRMRFVSPAAAYVILAYLNGAYPGGGHPNPRKFLEKPEVAAKFPGLATHRFAAPDFAA